MSDPLSSPGHQTVEIPLVVKNKLGIHARPAAMIVRLAKKYDADVFVQRDDDQVDGKSIMGLMMLAAGKGSKLKFGGLTIGATMIAGCISGSQRRIQLRSKLWGDCL